MQSKTLYYTFRIETPIGTMIAVADANAITSLDFADGPIKLQNSDNPLLVRLEKELEEYFAGERNHFTLPLNPEGTVFQKQVWKTLLSIPYGKTISYAEEAQRFGNPKATRAVANANGKNPVAILIPCHRVIASDGTLGGYSGGIEKKEFLLKLESEKRSS